MEQATEARMTKGGNMKKEVKEPTTKLGSKKLSKVLTLTTRGW